jgi:hypothetical protein
VPPLGLALGEPPGLPLGVGLPPEADGEGLGVPLPLTFGAGVLAVAFVVGLLEGVLTGATGGGA